MRYAIFKLTVAFDNLFEEAGTILQGQSEGADEVVKGEKRIRKRNPLPLCKSGNKGALMVNPETLGLSVRLSSHRSLGSGASSSH